VKKKGRAASGAGLPGKAWSGRFREETAPEVERFTESVSYDRRLCRQDILGSIAHVRMLAHRKILPAADARRIEKGLREIAREVDQGRFRFSSKREDVHMNVEAALTEKIGEAGARLHTGRSRNDQVALDMRLYLREAVDEVREGLLRLQDVLLDRAQETLEVVLPGYTHLQKAQPVRLAHHLLAYYQMFSRDEQRLLQVRERVDVMPLGAGAIAGSGHPVDPAFVARLLGFSALAANSMDAVSDRDFAIEFCFASSMILLHLSRWSEELILWSSEAFGFVELSDAYCTGSSMMPQKKNPDVLELIRGKTGGVYGDLVSLLVLMKGLPLTYQRDMQEDKVPLFHAADAVKACLSVFALLLGSVCFQTDRMRNEAERGFLNATDLADELARKGVPFRRAHAVAGRAVRYCLDQGKRLEDLTGREWEDLAPEAGPGIRRVLSIERVVEARNVPGGTARAQVRKQLRRARAEVEQRRSRLEKDRRKGLLSL
jgi:argininosuccinate lyase